VRVNLPGYRHPVVHFCPLPPKEATRPEAHHFLRKYEFCSWKNADCCCAVFWSRKSSRAGIEVVGHKFVADLCRTRFDAVQAVVAHVAISASIPPNCLEKWRKISRYAVSSHSCQQSRLTARARPSPGAALLGQHARGVVSFLYAPRTGGAYDSHPRTTGIAGPHSAARRPPGRSLRAPSSPSRCGGSASYRGSPRATDRPFSIQEHAMRKVLRGYAKDKNGNLILIGTTPVLFSKDKCSPATRQGKRDLVRQGATIFKKETISLIGPDQTPGEISWAKKKYRAGKTSISLARRHIAHLKGARRTYRRAMRMHRSRARSA